jgi:hypothetical protein
MALFGRAAWSALKAKDGLLSFPQPITIPLIGPKALPNFIRRKPNCAAVSPDRPAVVNCRAGVVRVCGDVARIAGDTDRHMCYRVEHQRVAGGTTGISNLYL